MEQKIFSGQRFGMLLVIEKTRPDGSKCFKWKCQCDCGNIVYVYTSPLLQGQKSCGCILDKPRKDLKDIVFGNAKVENYTKNGMWNCLCLLCGKHFEKKTGDINRAIKKGSVGSCGCIQSKKHFIDIRGKIFGNLTVLDEPPIRKNKGNFLYWNCKCKCGNIVIVKGSHLKSGGVRSCGCLLYEKKLNKYNLEGDFGIGYTHNGFEFYFDIEDYDKIKDWTWHVSSSGHVISKTSKDGVILLHRKILQNNNMSVDIDHIDRNALNNKKENLRICSRSDNMHNRKYSNDKVLGVNQDKKTNLWVSNISKDWQNIELGKFLKYEDAVIARLRKELELFGREFSPQRNLFERYNI